MDEALCQCMNGYIPLASANYLCNCVNNWKYDCYRDCPCRERYRDLIKQCQTMHSSVGTGSLAYAVGSKVMDMRTSSKDDRKMEAKIERSSTSNDNNIEVGKCCERGTTCTGTENASQQESSNDWVDLVSLRGGARVAKEVLKSQYVFLYRRPWKGQSACSSRASSNADSTFKF